MKKAIVDILLYLFTIFIGAIVFSIIGAVLNNAINPGSGMDSVMDNPWLWVPFYWAPSFLSFYFSWLLDVPIILLGI
jgi:hypothetical protein